MNTLFRIAASLLILCTLPIESAQAQLRKTKNPAPETKSRKIEYKDQLLPKIMDILDKYFGQWKFATGLDEYPSLSAPLRICHINADTIQDYAFHIMVDTSAEISELFIALVSTGDLYKLYALKSFTSKQSEFGRFYLQIFEHGTVFDNPPFERDGDRRKSFPTDCISISMREKNICEAYLFERESFKIFSPCD